jgi:hypothetical protein
MLKRVALIGAIAALTIGNPSNSMAQNWGGRGPGAVSVTVGFPQPIPAPVFRRPISCCFRPRPIECCCCNRPLFPRPYRWPPYFYGDYFAPYVYNWNRYDADYDGGYDGW